MSTAYSPRPSSLITLSDSSSNVSGERWRSLLRNASSARASGSPGSVAPRSAARSTMRGQRSGVLTTRRSEGERRAARNAAVAPLAAIMKSSIRSRARPIGHRLEIGDAVAVHHRPHLRAIEIEGALGLPVRAQRLRDPVLLAQLRFQPADLRERGRRRALAFEPRAHLVVRQLRPIAHHRPIDVGLLDEAGGIDVELNDDRRAIDVGQQRRLVGRQRLGEHREDARRRVDGRRVRLRVTVDRDRPAPRARRRRRSPPAHATPNRCHRRRPRADRDRATRRCRSTTRADCADPARRPARWRARSSPRSVQPQGSRARARTAASRGARRIREECGRSWKVHGSMGMAMGPWGVHEVFLWTYGPMTHGPIPDD